MEYDDGKRITASEKEEKGVEGEEYDGELEEEYALGGDEEDVVGMIDWAGGVGELVGKMMEEGAVKARSELTAGEEFRCQINGGSMLTWLNEKAQVFMEDRQNHCWRMGALREPKIFFSSDATGLVAAREILGPDSEDILAFPHDELLECQGSFLMSATSGMCTSGRGSNRNWMKRC